MIAIKRGCLDTAEIKQVLAGRMAQDDFDSALSHLDNCDQCRDAADQMQQEGNWLLESLGSDQPDPLQAETACQVALWRMLETPASTPHNLGTAVPRDRLGPYQLIQALGVGGMGTVYLAEHERLKRQCAIKLLPRERVDQPGWLDRFDREMTTVASLEHPNVVRASDAGHEDGWHYLVMEHLDGLDAGRIASRMGQLKVADACEIVRQAALGLAHVHDHALVHRDIKPSNIMLTRSGVVKLLDLGLVLAGDDPLGVDDRLTTVGHMMGTMPYMAPEQLVDSRDVDPRADIYSLGATLYRLIAGRPPHQRRGGLASQVLAIANEDPPALDSLREDIDRDVVILVGEMLARDPAKRPSTAAEVANRLSSFSSVSRLKGLLREALRRRSTDDSIQPSLMPSVARASKPPRSGIRKWLMGGTFAALIALAAIVIKIETDKGNLVIHSEHDGLTIVVKQGDEEVDRLTLSDAKENRKILRKGTYRVEIEGGGDALVLSDDVVTIARGVDSKLAVLEKPQPHTVIAGLTQRASRSALFRGRDLDEWMDALARENELDSIGEAIGAVVSLSGGYADEKQVEVAAAILKRAREFGGLKTNTPPPPNSSGFSISASEHFMWYVRETFQSIPLQSAIVALNKELESGNGRSGAAVLYIIPFYDWSTIYRLQEHVDGRLQLGQLMRNAAGLANPDAEEIWKGLSEEDQDAAPWRAYHLALRLAILRDVDPMTIPPLAQRFKTRELDEMTIDEQLVRYASTGDEAMMKPVSDGIMGGQLGNEISTVFAERFSAAIQKWALLKKVSNPIVSVDRDPNSVDETTDPAAAEPLLLFQGKDLATWMALLSREQDPVALGTVLNAVEVLTRDSESRALAAAESLKTARRWGGMITSSPPGFGGSSSDENPSHLYMHYLLQAFPGYLPEPGLKTIATELHDGTSKSWMASIWLLENYSQDVYGDVNFGATPPGGRLTAEQWIAKANETESGKELMTRLLDGLKLSVGKWKSNKPSSMEVLAIKTAHAVATRLLLFTEKPIESEPWVKKYVAEEYAKAKKAWSQTDPNTDKSVGFNALGQMPSWIMNEDIVVAAMQLYQVDEETDWQHFAATLLDARYYTRSKRTHDAIAVLDQQAPEVLHAEIERRLQGLLVPGSSDDHSTGQSSIGRFGGGSWHPLFVLAQETSVWKTLLPIYAKRAEPPADAVKLLKDLRERMKLTDITSVLTASKNPYTMIDDAIEIAKSRNQD